MARIDIKASEREEVMSEVIPGMRCIHNDAMGRVMENIDPEDSVNFFLEAFYEALALGAESVYTNADCPPLVVLYGYEHAFILGQKRERLNMFPSRQY